MKSKLKWEIKTVEELIHEDIIYKPIDGNHGNIHPTSKDFTNNGIPFIMASDIKDSAIDLKNCKYISEKTASSLQKGFAKSGDVLLTHKATIGRTAIVRAINSPYIILTPQVTYYRIKNTNILSNRYLKYYFDSKDFQDLLYSWASGGSTRAYIGITAQRKLPIVLPPLPTQKKIAHILSTLDDKIELNRQMNRTLEAMAQAIFKSWFVDFDPVYAKMQAKTEADLDAAARELGISRDILDLFPDKLVESEMGMVPEEWEIVPFSKVAKLDTTSIKPFNYPDIVWKHYSIPAFDSKHYPVLEKGSEIKSNKYKVDKYAILSSKLNPQTQRTWLPNIKDDDYAICSTEFMQFVPLESDMRSFVYTTITSKKFQDSIKSRVTGTTGSRQRAQPKQVAEIDIVLPSINIVSAFSKIVDPVLQKILENYEEIQTLQKNRDILLPKLLSGELDVSNIEVGSEL